MGKTNKKENLNEHDRKLKEELYFSLKDKHLLLIMEMTYLLGHNSAYIGSNPEEKAEVEYGIDLLVDQLDTFKRDYCFIINNGPDKFTLNGLKEMIENIDILIDRFAFILCTDNDEYRAKNISKFTDRFDIKTTLNEF